MSKKKIPEVRLLLDMEGLYDMDRDEDENQIIVRAVLTGDSMTLTAWRMEDGQPGQELGDEGKDYASLGVVVLSKRKHAKAIKELEYLRDTESTVAWSKAIIDGIIKGLSV